MQNKEGLSLVMHRRRITLSDGRYLIFYTFDGEGAEHSSDKETMPEPIATPVAEEERGV